MLSHGLPDTQTPLSLVLAKPSLWGISCTHGLPVCPEPGVVRTVSASLPHGHYTAMVYDTFTMHYTMLTVHGYQ
jgi:hypothetical protein